MKKEEFIKAPFKKENYIIMGIGLAFIILGYIFLAIGDITISPILLTLGFCVIIPIGIIYKKKKKKLS
ncbi:MAG: DUF3098 domain-containing protein [candidate division WOR-3 bacterium]